MQKRIISASIKNIKTAKTVTLRSISVSSITPLGKEFSTAIKCPAFPPDSKLAVGAITESLYS